MATVLQAQPILLEREVLGSVGTDYSGNGVEVSATIGESIIEIGQGNTLVLTQGFHQPQVSNLISAVIETTPESCRGANDGTASITTLEGCSEPYNILWSNGGANMSVGGLSQGTYFVTIVTDFCQTEIPFFIDAETDVICQLEFYSGITPNGDGDNDYWHIENIELPQFSNNTVRIFNRWGDEVWSTQGYDNDQVRWEGQGRSDGNLPDGTYFFVAEINGSTHKGYIELTR